MKKYTITEVDTWTFEAENDLEAETVLQLFRDEGSRLLDMTLEGRVITGEWK